MSADDRDIGKAVGTPLRSVNPLRD
jgi:hypothetical protein